MEDPLNLEDEDVREVDVLDIEDKPIRILETKRPTGEVQVIHDNHGVMFSRTNDDIGVSTAVSFAEGYVKAYERMKEVS